MGQGLDEMLPALQQLDFDHRAHAKALFDRAASNAAVPIAWAELGTAPVIAGLVRQAMWADLLILGQHDASDPLTIGVPADVVPSVLMASGRPALVVPCVDTGSAFGQDILIAWKPTRESAHAVSAAMPLLQRAPRIHLAIADDPDTPPDEARALEDFLRLHGVTAPVRQCAMVASADTGDRLLSLAADSGADLLVMGCYGHSRTRELVLGGATRTVLRSMTLPVLMAH